MSVEPDSQLDARMSDVPLPDGLLDRLRAIAEPSDGEIDRQLRDVDLPFGLVARLTACVADEAIDERLVDVPVPFTVLGELRLVPRSRLRLRVAQFALAASLMILLGGAYLAGLVGMLANFRPREAPVVALELPYDRPVEIESGFVQYVELATFEPPAEMAPPPLESIAFEFLELPSLQQPHLPAPGPAGELWRDLNQVRLDEDVLRLQFHDLVFTHHTEDDLPELDPSPERLTGNLEPPLVPGGFDRRAFYLTGVFPPVFPAADRSLRTSRPPLSTSTISIERLRRGLGDGEPPAPEDIRVEDFLAAVDYQFAPAEQGLALRTAAGPSTFTILPGQQPADGLLQVGVKAGEVLRSEPGGVHLIVALDASANMRWRGRIEICKQGLRRALAHLEPQDRFSLVAFDGQVVSAVENLSLAQIDEGYRLLDELQPHGGTNLAEGLRHAISLGLSESERSARVLLMTDGPGEMPRRLTDVVHGMLRSAAADGVTLSVIEMSDEPEIDSHLEQLAVEGAGLFYRASTSQHVRWTAVETLVGRSSLVAADARLEVTFNPNAVEAYRLLGHERTELVSDSEPTITADLHSDEEATALYQVWLKPGGDDNVATARLHWIDPASGKPRSSTQSITRVQFALSFERSPLSLQAAAIAAEAAEVLRESPFVASRSRSLANVLALAGRANPKLAERPAFRDFIGMLENAERVRIRPGVSPFRE